MYRDELEAMQAHLRTIEAKLEAEKKLRIAAEAETRAAHAAQAEAKLASEQTAEKRSPLHATSTIIILGGVLLLMLAMGVGLFLRVQRHQEQSARQLRDAQKALARMRLRLSQSETPPPRPAPPATRESTGGSGDLDALVDDALGGRDTAPAADADLPATLSRDQIMGGMKRIKGRVQACFDMYRVAGTVTVRVTIAGSGTVSLATVKGLFTGTPTGMCVQAAVRAATFPRFSGLPVTFDYPFILR